MVSEVDQEASARLRFGGGVHSRASESDISPVEASDGKNFVLDLENRDLRSRKPFDLVGTVPNSGEIRGFITLLESDGSVHFAVQADDKVYDWDGLSTFTEIATVNSNAKLRGRLDHNFTLDDKVLITDLTLNDVVMEWNGGLSSGDFADVSFTDEEGSAFGTFKAKYCFVANERAVFANIDDNGNAFPHLIVGAKRQDFTNITVSNRPSSALNAEDPWFLAQPDLKPINGVVEAFNQIVSSSREGDMFRITGQDASDFSVVPLFPQSGAKGEESVVYIGNDIAYGRAGVIESIRATDQFGDVDTNDLSIKIADQIEAFDDWTAAYNSRLQRVYFFPASASEVWVYHKTLRDADISPWVPWTTEHSLAFRPSAVMNMLDPQDSLEYVFMGDDSGNIYRLEGSGSSGDGGSQNIRVTRTSRLFELPRDANIYDVEGWVRYRNNQAFTLTLDFLHAGENLFDRSISVSIDASAGGTHYSNSKHYGGGEYYASGLRGRLARKNFASSGFSNEIQVRATVEGTNDIAISEIGLNFKAVS